MLVDERYLTTKQLPHTQALLQKQLPSIFSCTCFNDYHLPFSKELVKTELGHLFEHILLEYLCMIKLTFGHESAEFSGRTFWNWIHEKRGTFHIDITKQQKDDSFLPPALEQAVFLFNSLLKNDFEEIAYDQAIS